MKTAIDGAVKWLTEKARNKTMAYSFFKSAIDHQIEWATKRKFPKSLNFTELSEAVKAELIKQGYKILNAKDNDRQQNLFSEGATSCEILPAIVLSRQRESYFTLEKVFGWLKTAFERASAGNYSQIRLSACGVKEEYANA